MKKNAIPIILVLACMAGPATHSVRAADLTTERDTPMRSGEMISIASAETVYAGALAGVWTNGLGKAAADDATIVVIGRAENTAAAGEMLTIRRGVFRWANGGALTDQHIGQFCYVEDNQTVTTADEASGDAVAGIIVDVDTDGVWVDSGSLLRALSGSYTSLASSGNATVGGTLAVSGATTLSSTLAVAGVATLTAAPKLTATTSPAAQTLTITNGPSVTATASPAFVTIAIGADNYVVPAWKKQ